MCEQPDKGFWLRPKSARRKSHRDVKESTNRRERRRARQCVTTDPQYKKWNGHVW